MNENEHVARIHISKLQIIAVVRVSAIKLNSRRATNQMK
jgi:hypothetical protein